ncbi:MAG: hypothetical protein KDA24_10120 [Deltaproteobacteria bacterium]|nr:hypothetical protein [Deltaproteobacteria bacterium]
MSQTPSPESSPAASPDVFPSVTSDAWAELVRTELKGKDPASLFAITRHGYRLHPVYRAEDLPAGIDSAPGEAPFVRGGLPVADVPEAVPHVVLQRHVDSDRDTLRDAINEDVTGGVTGLWLEPRLCGISSPEGMETILGDIDVRTLRRLAVDGCSDGAGRLTMTRAWLDARGVDPGEVALSLRVDPLGSLLRDGALPGSLDDALDSAADLVRTCISELPAAVPLTLTAGPIDAGGGSLLHSIGWLLANAAWLLRGLEARGLSPAQVAPRIELHLPLGRDVFAGIAAVRATRLVWHRLMSLCGIDSPAPARIHADCATTAAASQDPWTNALRTSTQVFAGMVGGADAITAAPWDLPLGIPESGPRRLARNTHFVLGEEAHVARIADPAGGSFHVEDLTAELARAGWAALRSIEAKGGAAEALTSGWIKERLDSTWHERVHDAGAHKEEVLGASIYPNADAVVPPRRPHPFADVSGLRGVSIGRLPFRPDADAHQGDV